MSLSPSSGTFLFGLLLTFSALAGVKPAYASNGSRQNLFRAACAKSGGRYTGSACLCEGKKVGESAYYNPYVHACKLSQASKRSQMKAMQPSWRDLPPVDVTNGSPTCSRNKEVIDLLRKEIIRDAARTAGLKLKSGAKKAPELSPALLRFRL